MRFRIYYGDGATYTGDPWMAPGTGVQVIAQEADNERGFILTHGKDAYYWRPDIGWQGCDTAGLWDYLMTYRGPKAILFGRTIRDDAFWAVVGLAGREGLG